MKYDQAIELLESLDPYSGTWSGRVLVAFARTLARADKTEEAEKAYRVLINNEEIPAGRRGIAYLELGNLFAQAGETEKAVETYSAMREGEQFRSDHREQAEKALEDIENK